MDEACPKCGSTEFESEDDGPNVCDNCGLRWHS
ncbi:TFIIB-type zinc finger domain-containing protein [Halobellus sp. GM3]